MIARTRAPALPVVAPARDPRRAALWMIAAQLFFAWMGIGARLAGRGVPWPEVGAARFLVGGLTAYAVARACGRSVLVRRKREAWLRSGFGTLSAAGTFFVYAAPNLAVGDAVTVLATAPIFVVLLGVPLLGERLRAPVVAALALGFAGIAVIARPTFSTAGSVLAAGEGGALASAFAMVWLRRLGQSESGEAIVVHLSSVGFVAMLIASLPTWKTPAPRDLAALAATGLSGGFAQIAMTRAYSLDEAGRVSILSFSSVVFVRALAVPVFGEIPGPLQIAGSALVIAAGVLLGLSPATRTLRDERRTL